MKFEFTPEFINKVFSPHIDKHDETNVVIARDRVSERFGPTIEVTVRRRKSCRVTNARYQLMLLPCQDLHFEFLI